MFFHVFLFLSFSLHFFLSSFLHHHTVAMSCSLVWQWLANNAGVLALAVSSCCWTRFSFTGSAMTGALLWHLLTSQRHAHSSLVRWVLEHAGAVSFTVAYMSWSHQPFWASVVIGSATHLVLLLSNLAVRRLMRGAASSDSLTSSASNAVASLLVPRLRAECSYICDTSWPVDITGSSRNVEIVAGESQWFIVRVWCTRTALKQQRKCSAADLLDLHSSLNELVGLVDIGRAWHRASPSSSTNKKAGTCASQAIWVRRRSLSTCTM
jgi:hypothetical protein